MTDTTNTSATDEDEFYVDAQDNFPDKFDFEDRLVAIWPTGKTGTRPGTNGKPYPWIETLTLALDDGPDGDKGTGIKGDPRDGNTFLVGPAPASAEDIQWSAAGIYSRVRPRLGKLKMKTDGTPELDENGQPIKDYRPVIGRINRIRNKDKSLADPWSLAKPAEADRAAMLRHAGVIKTLTAKVKEGFEKDADVAAFDE